MMSHTLLLPELPLGGGEATVVRWLVAPGSAVPAGQPLLILLTPRAEVALPAEHSLTLVAPLAAEGDAVAVGGALAEVDPDVPPRPTRLTPVARRIAAEHQLALDDLSGSGPSGWVTKRDVLKAVGSNQALDDSSAQAVEPPSLPPPAFNLTPYALTVMEADCSTISAADARARIGVCVAQALLRHRLLQGQWSDEGLIVPRRVHLSVGGVLVRDAQDLTTRGLARALGAGDASTAADATFAITFGGGGWSSQGRSERTELHVGRIAPQAVVLAGAAIGIRRVALLTLHYDARAIDQRRADEFLRDVCARIKGDGQDAVAG